MSTTPEIFGEIAARLNASNARLQGVNATFQFDLNGDDGGTYFIRVAEGQAQTGAGAPEAPQCTVVMSAADFKELVAGRLNSTAAFMGGKLTVRGDMSLAMRLGSLLQ